MGQVQRNSGNWYLASGGTLDNAALALSALREDLATLATTRPLFCFDELELLVHDPNQVSASKGNHDGESPVQAPLVAFLDGLVVEATVLLIGQQIEITTPDIITLSGLSTPAITQIFAQAGQPIAGSAADQLYHATAGNPRLLSLCLTLHQRGEAIAEISHALGREPTLGPLFQRIRRRLSTEEEAVLNQLAVFRRPAPQSVWPDTAVAPLLQKRLLIADGQGGLEMVPTLRAHLYTALDAATRQRNHQFAAETRLLHAEYTAAAHHLIQGEQPAVAIQLWYGQREQELRRGQAGAAFALFARLSPSGLKRAEADALTIIQAELHKLRGEFEPGLTTLNRAVDSRTPDDDRDDEETEILIQIEGLRGEFLELLGNPESALDLYEQALQTTSRLLNRQVALHRQRSMLFVRQRELGAAWHEVHRAECQLQIVRGILADEEGRYGDAQAAFETALAQAETLDDQAALALAERHLANTHGRLQALPQAESYAHRAVQRYETLGDSFNVARVYDNLAFCYLHAKAVDKGIAAARKAHQFFLAAKSVYYSAIVATNLAEAYFDAGDLAQAEAYAHQVLDSEERQPLPYALFTLGRIHQQRGQSEHAHHSFAESVRVAAENADRFMEAYARRALGLVLCEMGREEVGRDEVRRALVLFQALEIAGEVAETARCLG